MEKFLLLSSQGWKIVSHPEDQVSLGLPYFSTAVIYEAVECVWQWRPQRPLKASE